MALENERRVTLRDIAAATGVHFTTVSLALRNHPRLPAATCRRVQAQAKRMGYVPDPMLASLASYRRGLRPASYHATLAWVTNFPTAKGWRKVDIFREQFEGASARAAEIGYKLEHFWLAEPGLTAARAGQILRARNITGLIIAPLPQPGGQIDMQWQDFSAVTIGYSLAAPLLHVVCAHQYRCIRLAVQELKARGYQRIGMVMLQASDDRVDHNWLAGFQIERHAAPRPERLAHLLPREWDERKFAAWVRRERPQAIITKLPQVRTALTKLAIKVPGDIGLVYLSETEAGVGHARVDENPRWVGAAAVDFVVGMLQRNERGVPAQPQRLMIDGQWVEGPTVRGRPARRRGRAGT